MEKTPEMVRQLKEVYGITDEEIRDSEALSSVWRRLGQNPFWGERVILLRRLVELLKSSSIAISRSAKYVLMWNFGMGKDKENFSYGPPSEEEIRVWEEFIEIRNKLNEIVQSLEKTSHFEIPKNIFRFKMLRTKQASLACFRTVKEPVGFHHDSISEEPNPIRRFYSRSDLYAERFPPNFDLAESAK